MAVLFLQIDESVAVGKASNEERDANSHFFFNEQRKNYYGIVKPALSCARRML